MEWTVVHFIKENVVEAVPVTWLHDDLCYWPPYNGKRLIHAVAVCEKPIFGSWPLFKIRKLGNGRTYSDLVKARAKACTAEDTSDLTSDPEERDVNKCMNPELPSCKIVKKVKGKGFDTNPAEQINEKKKKSLISTNDARNVSFTETSSDNEVGHFTHFLAVPDHTEIDANMCITSKPLGTSAKKMIIGNSNKENVVKPVNVTSNTNKLQKNIVTQYSKDNTTKDNTRYIDETDNDIAFKRQVLRQLHIINLKQSQICEDVQIILRKIGTQEDRILIRDNEDSIFKKFDFPLKNISELNAVEEHLTDENNTNMLVIELSKIGGATYKHTIKRIMFQLFSNEVAEKYSWIGFKGKNNFSLLRISAAIIKAVQKTHNAITFSDIETVMKAWLVKAKSRNAKQATKQ